MVGHAVRRGGAGKALVGALVAGILIALMLWGLLGPAPRLAPPDHVQALVEINDTLDAFHQDAADANGPAYFAHFAPDGVFLGTDATERWTVAQFHAYADPIFAKGAGWTYVPIADERHIDLIAGDTVAVFDELLLSDKFGTCRGTGVMQYDNGQWLIVQYNLHFPVPNDLAEQVTEFIQENSAPAPAHENAAPEE